MKVVNGILRLSARTVKGYDIFDFSRLKCHGTADAICLFSIFTIERDAKFQLRLMKIERFFFCFFFSIQVLGRSS